MIQISKLTEKQKAFADFYIESLNATEAAIKAGYSKKTAKVIGCENLTKPYIKRYVDEKMAKKSKQRVASQDEVLEYLTKVMRGEIDEECIVVESKGDFVSEAKKVTKQVTPKDRTKAAELLGKRYGIFEKEEKGNDKPIEIKIISASKKGEV